MQKTLRQKDDVINELRRQLKEKDDRITELTSQLDKYQSILPSSPIASKNGPRKQRAQGISAEPHRDMAHYKDISTKKYSKEQGWVTVCIFLAWMIKLFPKS